MIRTFQKRMAASAVGRVPSSFSTSQRTPTTTRGLRSRLGRAAGCSSSSSLCRRHRSGLSSIARSFSSNSINQPALSSKNDDDDKNDVVTTTIDSQGIAYVTLNRPDKLNALNIAMFRGLQRAALQLATEHSQTVRVVILRGAGRAFCTGLDVPSLLQFQDGTPWQASAELLAKKPLPIASTNNNNSGASSSNPPSAASTSTTALENENDPPPSSRRSDHLSVSAKTTNLAQDVGYLWRQLPVPVICSLHGMCYGGGLQIALGADVRLCHPDTKLSIMESKWGLIPDMSLTVTLRELLPMDVVKEWLFTGRIVRGADAAGLVTRCCDDPHTAADALAQELIQKSPDALRLGKQLVQQAWAGRFAATEQDCLEWETDYQKQLLLSWNQVAASARNFGWKLPYRTTGNNSN